MKATGLAAKRHKAHHAGPPRLFPQPKEGEDGKKIGEDGRQAQVEDEILLLPTGQDAGRFGEPADERRVVEERGGPIHRKQTVRVDGLGKLREEDHIRRPDGRGGAIDLGDQGGDRE